MTAWTNVLALVTLDLIVSGVWAQAPGRLPRAGPSPSEFNQRWQTATPGSQGMSKAKLDALERDLSARGTKALLVIRNDKIVLEWYAADHGPTKTHYTASLAKAIVGGVSLAVALTDGRIALDDPAAKYIPSWQADPRKSKITLRHLGSHTSGLDDAEADGVPHERLAGWKGDFWKRLPPPNDPFTIARDQTRLLFEPGERHQYSNPGIAMLSWCVTAALADAPHRDLRTLLRERVMRPIGVPDNQWSVGYGATVAVDRLPLVASWGGGAYTARAVAAVGRLMLREGPYTRLPKDAFWGAGAGHQVLLVIPSLNLIAVRNGAALASTPDQDYHAALGRLLFDPLVDTVGAAPE